MIQNSVRSNGEAAVPLAGIASLVAVSGCVSLVYQTVWFREFRLIFGASTPATAAVLAIFMAGLGWGSLALGRRSESWIAPLRLYALLEFGIAILAACSPLLLQGVRAIYIAAGGTEILGTAGGAVVRLVLSALVLLPPTFLMGGTLPAIARSVECAGDSARRRVALAYGLNTLGACLGVVLTTFFLVQQFGARMSVWVACLLNLVVAICALVLSRRAAALDAARSKDITPDTATALPDGGMAAKPMGPEGSKLGATGRVGGLFVLAASCASGLVFFLMELVWYRMLTPILGGSTYTFGVVLATALLGIGLGGAVYSLSMSGVRPRFVHFAWSCALQALCIAVPFAAGDSIAFLTLGLRDLSLLGFGGVSVGWFLAAACVVLPAAAVAGFQFPLLLAVMGSGREAVGVQTGRVYAANTVGAILGALGGGFGLMPLLGAVGLWKAVVVLLGILAVGALLLDWTLGRGVQRRFRSAPLALVGAATACLFASGPTAVWRHGGIGAGRSDFGNRTPNAIEKARNALNRALIWEEEGWESSVALMNTAAIAFIVDGKSDGSSVSDAGTQIMGGLIGAALHPDPKNVLVVGLGTGSSCGWLAAVEEVERVDVIELESAIVRVAEDCAPVNRDALQNPKVHVTIGDAREKLLVSGRKYDLIFSEPSNLYRAGIANLFTREFYRSCRARLEDGGLFLQFLQGYEISNEAILCALATIGSEFPHVSVWLSQVTDLILVASEKPLAVDAEALRTRLGGMPFREAMPMTWGVEGLEGFLARFVANDAFTRRIAKAAGGRLHTDDKPVMEFLFGKSVALRGPGFNVEQMLDLAARVGGDRPGFLIGQGLDETAIRADRLTIRSFHDRAWVLPDASGGFVDADRARVHNAFSAADWATGLAEWEEHGFQPLNPLEQRFLATAMTVENRPEAAAHVAELPERDPLRAALEAWIVFRQGGKEQSMALIDEAVRQLQDWPLSGPEAIEPLCRLARQIANGEPARAAELLLMLEKPFPLGQQHNLRLGTMAAIAGHLETETQSARTAAAIHGITEPWPIWDRDLLKNRAWAYQTVEPGSDIALDALDDFLRFERHSPSSFSEAVSGDQAGQR